MLNFTLKQLKYVEAAARLGSIAKAGAELNISQSSITAAIDALEEALDYDIFVRTPAKGIQTTPSGTEILQLIRGFIDQSRHFEADVQSVGGDASGLMRIACYATAAPSFLPPILKSISEKFPGISIKLLEGNMQKIMDFLSDGEADLVFTYKDSLDDRHSFRRLFDAPPYALMSVDDPLARRKNVKFSDLAEKPMVLLDLPRTREYFISMFNERGLHPNIVHSTKSSEIARALVAAGFGFSILNIRPTDYYEDSVSYRLLPIRDKVQTPVFGIATMAHIRQPKIVRAFIENCLELSRDEAFAHLVVK